MAGRLTYKKQNGEWGLLHSDIKKVPRELYGAICKLKDYEETELTPGECRELQERNTPMAPYPITKRPPFDSEYDYVCPVCGNEDVNEEESWCGKCGQRIGWDECEEEHEECKNCRRWTCLECPYADI